MTEIICFFLMGEEKIVTKNKVDNERVQDDTMYLKIAES
jgi:hypothetical protein